MIDEIERVAAFEPLENKIESILKYEHHLFCVLLLF